MRQRGRTTVAGALSSAFVAGCLGPPNAFARATAPKSEASSGHALAEWSVHGHLSNLVFTSVGVAAEWRPSRWFATSLGAGLGIVTGPSVIPAGQLMAHGLAGPSESAHSFEFALGLNAGVVISSAVFPGGVEETYADPLVLPAVFAGYRYHPVEGGLVIRGGVSYQYGVAVFLPAPCVSVGYAFGL